MNDKLLLFFLVILSLVGVQVLGFVIHEEIHHYDLRNVVKTDEKVCYFTLYGSNTAYYEFLPINRTELFRADVIRSGSEVKAYTIETFFLVLYAIFIFIPSVRRLFSNDKKL